MTTSVPFGSLLSKIIDNRGKTCPTSETGIPLIATNCVKNEHLYPVYEKVRYVRQEVYDSWFRGHPEPGDLIFVLKGTPGRVNWVNNPVDFCIAQDMVALRVDENKVYPKYLFAVLRSSQIQQEIEGLHVGSLIPHFKKSDFDDLQIPLVEEKLQKYIGDVYFNLSLKIDLLHRQNKTLEAMAETLFRQWFIEEAREDWNETKVLDVFSLVGGGTPKTSEASYWDGDIPWLSGGDIANAHQGFIVKAEKSITEFGLQKSSTKLLPKLASVISARGTVGKYAMLSKPMTFSQSNYGIVPKEHTHYYFVYLLLAYIVDELSAAAYGSVFDTITTRTFEDVVLKLPSMDSIAEFESEIAPLFEKKLNNVEQIQTLENLRDTLLPKLMSGEVRVQYPIEDVA
ncbi:restriction endonuclease subunit S [uncultured Acinetobacter sp.]|uniref:restriction endonuclease subunit S n=1 Tax=uncultured Acinetobacter sp. TaxID=165433 RepID=UPI002602B2FA|nr:restriction endonuclease subunit S [uncultured Acinetobacter sp.]